MMAKDLAELQEEVSARGYTYNFGSSDTPLPEIIASDLRVVGSVSVDSGTDPGDDATMYLIESTGENGYVIVSDSFHADSRKATFIAALLAQDRA